MTSYATVRFYNQTLGWGFAKPDEPNVPDVFLDQNQLSRAGIASVNGGDRISFDPFRGPKGIRARNICLIESAA